MNDVVNQILSNPRISKSDKVSLIERYRIGQARDCFWEYRKYLNPKMKLGWWQQEVAEQLQQFFEDYDNGLRPKLVIQAPPQHGKSVQVVEFIGWLLGKRPDTRCIYTSFSERLGVRANLQTQRIMVGAKYKHIFPRSTIPERNAVSVSGQKLRNREIIELNDHDGYFRNTTVGGSITGESLDLGVIDDPIRGRKDANSATVRNSTWDWFTDDFLTRFSESGALLCILTRWHIDDPIGRLIASDSSVKVLNYPAIATRDETHRKEGEALFPEHKSLEFLLERKAIMPASNFEALYQQNPFVKGGEMFRDEWWRYYKELPKLRRKIIYADTAIKAKEQNDFSVFQFWGESTTGQLYLIDQLRGKWEAPELLVQARAFYQKHRPSAFKVEDKASGTQLIQTLSREGIPIIGIPRNIDKVTRALGTSPMVESGNVYLPSDAPWLSDYLSEFGQFPNGANDDQVDPTMDAIEDLLCNKSINWESLL